jgi:hypothetical protein
VAGLAYFLRRSGGFRVEVPDVPAVEPPGTEPAPGSSTPATNTHFPEGMKEEWLEQLRRDHGEEWVRQNWARLEDEWAYLLTL